MLIKIHCLTHPNFPEDKNQALSIKTQVLALYPKMTLAKEWNINDPLEFTKLQQELKTQLDYQHIVIAVGSHGLEALEKIKPRFRSNMLSVYASHQIFSGFSECCPQIDILALPIQGIDEHFHPHLTLIPILDMTAEEKSEALPSPAKIEEATSLKLAKVIAKKIDTKEKVLQNYIKDVEKYMRYGVLSFRRMTGPWLESLVNLDEAQKYIVSQETKSIHQEELHPNLLSTSYVHLLPYIPNAIYRGLLLGMLAGSWEYSNTQSFRSALFKGSIAGCAGLGGSLWFDSSKLNMEECYLRRQTVQAILSPLKTQTNSPSMNQAK